jgi:alpha-L-rhamnosidase
LVEEKNESAVLDNLVNDIVEKNDTHLTTGVLGTKYLIEALSMYGRSDVAWALATQTTYPSWAEMMKRFNTMCEFWTLKQSHNHVMMGSIDAWFYKVLAGIQIDESQPAFRQFKVQPFIANGLDHVRATTNTLRGEISVSWEKEGSKFTMAISIPFNTTATVYVPGGADNHLYVNDQVLERVPSIEFLGYEDGYHVLRVPSGEWNFLARNP